MNIQLTKKDHEKLSCQSYGQGINFPFTMKKKPSFLTWNKTLNIELHFSSLLKTNIPYGNFTPNSPFQHPIFTHLHWRLLSNIWSSIHDHRQTGMAPWLHSHIYSKCNLSKFIISTLNFLHLIIAAIFFNQYIWKKCDFWCIMSRDTSTALNNTNFMIFLL